ncbi:MAG: antibiotic biosynthesis monooxygenase [Halothiobacillaceae bacterium]|nr:MAG: antibiotic biosynthesis monooxygenase [Halothiobacillaceae bacterium]
MNSVATTPEPPYYAVIFTSLRTEGDHGYGAMAEKMVEMARHQPGFLGFETARAELGISVSYWSSLETLTAWRENMAHRAAQQNAPKWYKSLRVRVCRVEREYGF